MLSCVPAIMPEPIGDGEDFVRLPGEPAGPVDSDNDRLVEEPVGDGDRLGGTPVGDIDPTLNGIRPP